MRRATMRSRRGVTALAAVLGLLVAVSASLLSQGAATAATSPDPFFGYQGSTPLAQFKPGAVLKTRSLPVHVLGLAVPVTAVQILYRSTSQLGQPTANVTSVLLPPWHVGTPKLLSYQSFYDSLNPEDAPSRTIAGGTFTIGNAISQLETGLLIPALLAGYTVTTSDTEGQAADFAAGPEYGMNTLDAIRATQAVRADGVPLGTPVGLIGYSGGAIASEWAAELAPTYAPDVSAHIVGTAIGGVLVDPAHNLHYIDGSLLWAGVAPMAIVGAARAFHIDLTPYLSAKGLQDYANLQHAGITQVLGEYPGLTWSQIAKPQYPEPETIPPYVKAVNHLIMGTGGTPGAPMFIGQGANGLLEGTLGDKPGIGAGDGVMITGDVRTLAREYCSRGVAVDYQQYDLLSHNTSTLPWAAAAVPWLADRFAGIPAPQDCSSIAVGNPLTPIPTP